MAQIDAIRTLPAPIGYSVGGRSFWRGPYRADFTSQVLAGSRTNAGDSRPEPAIGAALRTYDASGKLRIVRLPPGYRMSIVA